MENNNKSFEELADEALDKVAGGGGSWVSEMVELDDEVCSYHECSNCHKSVSDSDAVKRIDGAWFCKTCWYQLSGWQR